MFRFLSRFIYVCVYENEWWKVHSTPWKLCPDDDFPVKSTKYSNCNKLIENYKLSKLLIVKVLVSHKKMTKTFRLSLPYILLGSRNAKFGLDFQPSSSLVLWFWTKATDSCRYKTWLGSAYDCVWTLHLVSLSALNYGKKAVSHRPCPSLHKRTTKISWICCISLCKNSGHSVSSVIAVSGKLFTQNVC